MGRILGLGARSGPYILFVFVRPLLGGRMDRRVGRVGAFLGLALGWLFWVGARFGWGWLAGPLGVPC